MPCTYESDPINNADIEMITSELTSQGFLKVHTLKYRFYKFDGSVSRTITREVMDRGDATAVLPYDPATDRVALIRQHLAGNIFANVPNRPLQVIAGMVEWNESNQEVAMREAREEAGIEITYENLRWAQAFMPSPGGSSERVITFVGFTDLSKAFDQGVFGLTEEDEDIRLEILPAKEAIRRLDEGEIESGPAVTVLSWFARHHDRLRTEGLAALNTTAKKD